MKMDNRNLGKWGENRACAYLRETGYAILGRNWHFGHLEIDIICEIENQIVFVEVKTRRGQNYGGATMAVTQTKQKHLALAALAWLSQNGLWSRPCRFDIICLTGKPNNSQMEHFRNAFDIAGLMDCGYPAW